MTGRATRGLQRSISIIFLTASSLFVITCGAHTPPRVTGTPVVPAAQAQPVPGLPDWMSANVIDTAMAQLGVPYRNGGTDPVGFDCSGFVQFVYSRAGFFVAREVRHQVEGGMAVDAAEARPGDLIFFATSGRRASHVGIVLDETTFIHAPSSQGVVRIEPISGRYWRERYLGVRRMVPTEQVVSR
ncbi:MAG: C40 family peptidase [Acidobacteria bacterium]|nr:C40 family peptidase [Acidobacteriota bacterium]MBI3262427.1 C40 family peptidase [Acidobacteriota bacterium]